MADMARAAAVFPVGSDGRSFLDRAAPLIVGALLDLKRIAEATESKPMPVSASDKWVDAWVAAHTQMGKGEPAQWPAAFRVSDGYRWLFFSTRQEAAIWADGGNYPIEELYLRPAPVLRKPSTPDEAQMQSDDAIYEAERRQDGIRSASEAAFQDRLASIAAANIVGNKILSRLLASEIDTLYGDVRLTVLEAIVSSHSK